MCYVQHVRLPLVYYVCVGCSEALQVATFIRKNAKKQTTRFAGNLEIGPKLKIPIKIFTKVGEYAYQLHIVGLQLNHITAAP